MHGNVSIFQTRSITDCSMMRLKNNDSAEIGTAVAANAINL